LDQRALIKKVLSRTGSGVLKTAAMPPFEQDSGPPQDGPPVDGGAVEDNSGGGKRNIPAGHPYDPRALKPMATALWASSVSLGHALTAYRHLSRMKSATISPDGKLGGRGYVMEVADVRKKLFAACEALSAITDTLHDEITAPHWKPKLAELDESDMADVEKFVEESENILDDPESGAEEELDELEQSPKKKDKPKDEEQSSKIPVGGSSETQEAQPIIRTKEASMRVAYDYGRQANSSVPPSSLPGPRVEHLDRDMQQDPDLADDDWGLPGGAIYQRTEKGEGDLSNRESDSAVPDALTDTTPTDGYDYGLGYGAKGDGAGGYENPSDEGNNKGVWGPHAGLPSAPGGSSGDTTPEIESRLSQGELPGDDDLPVARSDYFRGDRGNLVNGPMAQAELPGEATPGSQYNVDMMNTDYTYQDVETPYVRYDYTTPNYRPDPLHNWPEKQQVG